MSLLLIRRYHRRRQAPQESIGEVAELQQVL
jgi:hypothetical protein